MLSRVVWWGWVRLTIIPWQIGLVWERADGGCNHDGNPLPLPSVPSSGHHWLPLPPQQAFNVLPPTHYFWEKPSVDVGIQQCNHSLTPQTIRRDPWWKHYYWIRVTSQTLIRKRVSLYIDFLNRNNWFNSVRYHKKRTYKYYRLIVQTSKFCTVDKQTYRNIRDTHWYILRQ